MDTNLKVQPTTVAGSDAESAPKEDWHAPVITRIDIKRATMNVSKAGSEDYTN